MDFGIIAWVWALFATIILFAWMSQLSEEARDRHLSNIKKYYLSFERHRVYPYALLAFFGLRVLWAMGLLVSIEVAGFAVAILFILRVNKKNAQKIQFEVKNSVAEGERIREVLGNDLPAWVTFPNVSRGEFWNVMLKGMWPQISASMDTTIRWWLNSLLAWYKPEWMKKLEMGIIRCGTVPFVVHGVECTSGDNDTYIDFHITWSGDPDIRLLAQVTSLFEVEAIVSEFRLSGVLRFHMGPHINRWPCFAAYSISFVEPPLIDFKLAAGKLNLDIFPTLSDFLDDLIRHQLVSSMVHPKRITWPMTADYNPEVHGTQADAIGVLYIHVREVTGIRDGLVSDPRTFLKLGIMGSSTVLKSSEAKGITARFDDHFQFIIYERHCQLKFALYELEKTNTLALTLSRKMQILDNPLLGSRIAYVSNLMDDRGGADKCERLSLPDRTQSEMEIHYHSVYFPFKTGQAGQHEFKQVKEGELVRRNRETSVSFDMTPDAPPASRVRSASPTPNTVVPLIVPRSPAPNGVHGIGHSPVMPGDAQTFFSCKSVTVAKAAGPSAEGTKPLMDRIKGPANKKKSNLLRKRNPIAVLFVTINQCNGLPGSSPNPFVRIICNDQKLQTDTVKETVDPAFFSTFPITIYDWHDRLDITVYNDRTLDTVLMAELKGGILVTDILRNNSRLKTTQTLMNSKGPAGTITMELKLKVVEEF